MKQKSKALEFIYQDTQIHFFLGNEKNVMVNATEMAKAFNKQIDNFTRLEGTKVFIQALIKSENSKFVPSDVREQTTEKDLIYSTNKATFMNKKLAMYFAFWLDVDFQIWIIDTIDDILFGHYKEHWEAHIKQEDAKAMMEKTKKKLLTEATQEDVIAYFKAEAEFNSAKNEKSKAIRNQYSLFEN